MNWTYIHGYSVNFKTLPFPTNNIRLCLSSLFILFEISFWSYFTLLTLHSSWPYCFGNMRPALDIWKTFFIFHPKKSFPAQDIADSNNYLVQHWDGWRWAGSWSCSPAETDVTLVPCFGTTRGNRWDNPDFPGFEIGMSSESLEFFESLCKRLCLIHIMKEAISLQYVQTGCGQHASLLSAPTDSSYPKSSVCVVISLL